MKRILFTISLLCLTFAVRINAQEEVTPTVEPAGSIFTYDTCAPPCWMGLIPGVSTSADVERMLEENPDLIDPTSVSSRASRLENGDYAIDAETGLITIGGYHFDVGNWAERRLPGGLSSRIEIRRGYVDTIAVLVFEEIPLQRVLEQMGTPDTVRLNISEATETIWLNVIYSKELVRVALNTLTDTCQMSSLLEQMVVFSMLYYSTDAARRIVQRAPEMPPQPQMTGYSQGERPVPLETWNAWINGEVDLSCAEAWEALPEAPV